MSPLLLTLLLACQPTDDTGRPGQDTSEPPIDADQRDHNLSTTAGDYAYDLLTATDYDRVVIEVDWVAGNAPDQGALDKLVAVVEELCDKPGGVELVLDDEIPPHGAPEWTYAAAQDLEVAWRDRYRDPETRTAVIYYLYLDGTSEGDGASSRILGYAIHGSSLVMFREALDRASGSLPLLGGQVEPTVLAHELGHLLGLVDNGIPMTTPHRDPDHGHHDVNDDCIMYWAVETEAITGFLGGAAPDFDAACRADMIAAGGRG